MLRKLFRRTPSPPSTIIPSDLGHDNLVEEETVPYSELRCFYPMHLGEVLYKRYQVTAAKLGFGGRSTVWLARDLRRWKWQKVRYVAIKVAVAGDLPDGATQDTELRALRKITKRNPRHPGYGNIATLRDTFYAPGPVGKHLCLVFEPLREPVRMIKKCFENDRLPLELAKAITLLTLEALDYLHTACHIIHCDISESNILFRFSPTKGPETLQEHSELERTTPLPVKRLADRTIYLSHDSFGPLSGNIGGCVLTDFDVSVKGGEEWNHDIQPTGMAAPEVLLRAKWSYSADIWNLGVLISGLMEGKPIFDHAEREHWRDFSEADSMARMIAFLGPPPAALLKRAERLEAFFDEGGVFKTTDARIPNDGCSFETFFTRLEGAEKEMFEDRTTAKELLHDPWVQSIRQSMQGK